MPEWNDIKRYIGMGLIEACTAVPPMKASLGSLGMRTKMEWFRAGAVPVRTVHGRDIRIASVRENYLSFKMFWLGMEHYEPETIFTLDALLGTDAVFLDVGANIGFYSLHAASADPTRRIFAFEPNPQLHALLQKNVQANGFSNVTCEASAVSSSAGTASLHLAASDMSSSLEQDFSHLRTGEMVEVPTISIDDYIKDRNITERMVMKVDVEGHEKQVFAGAATTLEHAQPDIIVEVAQPFAENPYPMLTELGYKFYRVTDDGLSLADKLEPIIKGHLWFSNYLCSTRSAESIERVSCAVAARMRSIDLARTGALVNDAKIQRLKRERSQPTP